MDILQGDALSVVRTLPAKSVQCCVTSPPYFQLRSYLPAESPEKQFELGTEPTPQTYIAHLVEVFREVRRVLKDDGTLWLNIGDSYSGSGKGYGDKHGRIRKQTYDFLPPATRLAMPAKNLLMIPARLALALQEDGWYLRADIIWHKGNAMPESVTDRPTNAHEHVYLLAKSERYYYNADAIREPCVTSSNIRNKSTETDWASNAISRMGQGEREWNHPLGRNKRDVWTVNSQPCTEAHFATMPPKLVEPCILAGSRVGDTVLDPFCGAGTVPLVALQHGRDALGIELNPAYIEIIHRRLSTVQVNLWSNGDERAS